MKTKNLLTKLSTLPYFTTQTAVQLSSNTKGSTQVLLTRLAQKGQIIRLKKGVYITRDFYLKNQSQPYFSNLISNIIQPNSYLSCQYVLQKHNILTQATYGVTAITSKNTQQIENKIDNFDYKHIKKDLYLGYQIKYHHQIACARATPPKALFDFFYFHSIPTTVLNGKSLVDDYRLNLNHWPTKYWHQLEKYVKLADSPKMSAIFKNLQKNNNQ